MADGVPSFSATANFARVAAGFKGKSNLFTKPMLPQAMTFVDGWADTGYAEIQQSKPIPQPTPTDPWNMRR